MSLDSKLVACIRPNFRNTDAFQIGQLHANPFHLGPTPSLQKVCATLLNLQACCQGSNPAKVDQPLEMRCSPGESGLAYTECLWPPSWEAHHPLLCRARLCWQHKPCSRQWQAALMLLHLRPDDLLENPSAARAPWLSSIAQEHRR